MLALPPLFDTHAHLDDEQFDSTRDYVIARAIEAGVSNLICVGTTATTSERCVVLSSQYSIMWAAVGIQPNYVAEASSSDWQRIVDLSSAPRVVALGETGLDRYWKHAPFELQQDYFDRHLRLSEATGLPFIVHMRDCDADVLEMLREARRRSPLRGVMHSFTGTMETAKECLELGLYISFAGMVTYPKSQSLRDIAAAVPVDRLLIETDSPYLSPHPKRGIRPNEPALVALTAACLADCHQITFRELAERSTMNAKTLFDRCGA